MAYGDHASADTKSHHKAQTHHLGLLNPVAFVRVAPSSHEFVGWMSHGVDLPQDYRCTMRPYGTTMAWNSCMWWRLLPLRHSLWPLVGLAIGLAVPSMKPQMRPRGPLARTETAPARNLSNVSLWPGLLCSVMSANSLFHRLYMKASMWLKMILMSAFSRPNKSSKLRWRVG